MQSVRSLGKYDLAAIAVGGVLGATVRHLVTRTPGADGGWFTYAPESSVVVGANVLDELDRAVVVSAWGIPLDTLAVNLTGTLLLGAITWLLGRSTSIPRRALLAAGIGFCGSLTTFSTWAVELAARFRAEPVLSGELSLAIRSGQSTISAVVYLVLSLFGGALAFWVGRRIANTVWRAA